MELDLIYSMIRKRKQGINTNVYIDCLRNQFFEMQEEFQLDREERDAAAEAEGAVHEDEEANDEADFEYDVPDLGRDALVALLAAAGVQELVDF